MSEHSNGQNSFRGDSKMQMKWKKTSAALLVATMTITGASYAWANENLFDTVDLSKLNSKTTEETTKVTSGDSVKAIVTNPETTTSTDATESGFPKIPEEYTAGNLAGLANAYENVGNETAKAAIKRNAERAIVKFEASQKERAEESVVENPVQEQLKPEESITVPPVVEEPEKEDKLKKEKKSAEKEERKVLQTEQKEERKALQVEHKEERKALQEEHKAEKQENKKSNKEDK